MKENGYMMSNEQVLVYIENWLEERRIKSFFDNKKENKKKYVKIKEEELYKLCYKLVDLIKENIE